jgi:hypothetical protein
MEKSKSLEGIDPKELKHFEELIKGHRKLLFAIGKL